MALEQKGPRDKTYPWALIPLTPVDCLFPER